MQTLSNASLEALVHMTTELGRLLSLLTLIHQQVWLIQSPLSEPCRKTLGALPVVPGQLFGPAAQQTLEKRLRANEEREQFRRLQGPSPLVRQLPPVYDASRI